MSVSQDGKWIYGQAVPEWGNGLDGCFKVTPRPGSIKPGFEFFGGGNDSSGNPVHDPFGNVAYLKTQTRMVNFQPIHEGGPDGKTPIEEILGKHPVGISLSRLKRNEGYRHAFNFVEVSGRKTIREPYFLSEIFNQEFLKNMCVFCGEGELLREIEPFIKAPSWWFDQSSDRIIVASLNRIASLPVAPFGLPDEPPLTLKKVFAEFTVGRNLEVKIDPTEEGTSVEILQHPEEMVVTDKGFLWEPLASDIGNHRVELRLTNGNRQRDLACVLRVSMPSMKSPAVIDGMVVDPQERFALVWSGLKPHEQGGLRVSRAGLSEEETQFFLFPFRGSATPQRFTIHGQVRKCMLAGSLLVVLPVDKKNHRLEIIDLRTRQRKKTLLPASEVLDAEIDEDALVLACVDGNETYSLSTFQRLQSKTANVPRIKPTHSEHRKFMDGYMTRHAFRDKQSSSLALILSPPGCSHLFRINTAEGSFLRQQAELPDFRLLDHQDANSQLRFREVHSQSTKMVGELRYEPRTKENGINHQDSPYRSRVLWLALKGPSGDIFSDVPIAHEYARGEGHSFLPVLVQAGDHWYIARNRDLYRFTPPPRDSAPLPEASAPQEFHFIPRQSQFTIGARPSRLTHALRGGDAPFDFNLVPSVPGLEMDSETGVVSVDGTQIRNAAIATIIKPLRRTANETAFWDSLRRQAEMHRTYIRKHLDIGLKGIPFAIPIRLKAIDAKGSIAEMQYFVLLDLPFGSVEHAMK